MSRIVSIMNLESTTRVRINNNTSLAILILLPPAMTLLPYPDFMTLDKKW